MFLFFCMVASNSRIQPLIFSRGRIRYQANSNTVLTLFWRLGAILPLLIGRRIDMIGQLLKHLRVFVDLLAGLVARTGLLLQRPTVVVDRFLFAQVVALGDVLELGVLLLLLVGRGFFGRLHWLAEHVGVVADGELFVVVEGCCVLGGFGRGLLWLGGFWTFCGRCFWLDIRFLWLIGEAVNKGVSMVRNMEPKKSIFCKCGFSWITLFGKVWDTNIDSKSFLKFGSAQFGR